MGTEENIAASAGDERDDLKTIDGVGRAFSEALHTIGIHRFAELAAHTPDTLSALLREKAGKNVKPGKIKEEKWIEQARERAQPANTERTPLEEEEAEAAKAPQQAHPKTKKEWEQHAGFSVFFDYKIDEHGKQVIDEHGERIWQTRVYDNKSGVEEPLSGIDTVPWVNWILERAKLPVAADPIPTETEVAAPPAPVTPYDAQIEILDVEVSQIPTSIGVREKRLMAEVRFQVSGPGAETLTADRIPFQIEVHTVDVESGAWNLVASERRQLQPEKFEYRSQQEFPIPDLGHYELQSIVFLLPPDEMMAFHQGAPFRVVSWSRVRGVGLSSVL